MDIIIEIIFIILTLAFSSIYTKKDSRKVFAIAFILILALCFIFSIVQILTILNLFEFTRNYTPLEITTTLSVMYWIAFAFRNSKFWDKVTG